MVDKVGLFLHTAAGPGPLLFLSAFFRVLCPESLAALFLSWRWLELPPKSFSGAARGGFAVRREPLGVCAGMLLPQLQCFSKRKVQATMMMIDIIPMIRQNTCGWQHRSPLSRDVSESAAAAGVTGGRTANWKLCSSPSSGCTLHEPRGS